MKKITLPGECTTDFDSENEVVSKPAPQSVVKATKHSKKSPKNTSRKPQSSSTPILKPPAGLQINKNTSNVTEIPAKQTVDTGNIICCRTSRTSENDDSFGTQDYKPCNHNPIILDITTWECHHFGSIIRIIRILLTKVVHHLLLGMIFPASLWVMSQAVAIHLSLLLKLMECRQPLFRECVTQRPHHPRPLLINFPSVHL
ncbi:uncharacterized protein LOC124338518 [Daphnia pulicaria]|uniref:uncharacterized protein LOC124338518 n=1 Tax=Daphnia pulicaria TaxID=35523 RepID=UPI001EEA1197|nr:uncharacterized protein LOC124338518 [Daphnia pulicaria]